MAYEISYNHYLQFLAALKHLNPELYAFIPIESSDNTITFSYQPLSTYLPANTKVTPTLAHLDNAQHTLSIKNNCRTTAVDLAKINLPWEKTTYIIFVTHLFFATLIMSKHC